MSTYRMAPPPPPPALLGYEVDFLPAGDGEKSGDAIALRFGNLSGLREEQTVVVIDGGFQDDGEALVSHIRRYYGTDTVDLVVSTHPDQDHAAGLAVVLQRLTVRRLWMHRPWEHADAITLARRKAWEGGRSTEEKLKRLLDDASALERASNLKRIPVEEPFTGIRDPSGTLWVLGPSQDFYEGLLRDFRGTPDTRTPSLRTMLGSYYGLGVPSVARPREDWRLETLGDDVKTSEENESSAVILANFPNGDRWLFTGDAGILALTQVANLMDQVGLTSAACGFIQIPHHGSRHNVGPTILNRLVGPKLPTDEPCKLAVVSAAKNDRDHPSKRVTNAFTRRGAIVRGTKCGRPYCYPVNAPPRGWPAAEVIPFDPDVGEED